MIAARANELLSDWASIRRTPYEQVAGRVTRHDYRTAYCDDLANVIDLDAIRAAGLNVGADPMGGASVQYWEYIAERLGLGLSVVNPRVDPAWPFMTLDWDGKIRMDCSSPYAMASLIDKRDSYDLATGNDADADRHGIVTPDAGLMNPNHYLAVAIWYLFSHRDGWDAGAGIGKTLVSSSMIDNVARKLGKRLVEVPVGFKWFVPGLSDGSIGFGGEESAGASFLTRDGRAANQAFSVVTLRPPIGASLPAARVSLAVIGSPASSVAVTASGESLPSAAFSSRVAAASILA